MLKSTSQSCFKQNPHDTSSGQGAPPPAELLLELELAEDADVLAEDTAPPPAPPTEAVLDAEVAPPLPKGAGGGAPPRSSSPEAQAAPETINQTQANRSFMIFRFAMHVPRVRSAT
ncbi:MAG TPA: hypothetical protein VFB62_02345 [Polyangiaceae bacterium]|nr:hypothetical protein [Polyangiaceae bacterium]